MLYYMYSYTCASRGYEEERAGHQFAWKRYIRTSSMIFKSSLWFADGGPSFVFLFSFSFVLLCFLFLFFLLFFGLRVRSWLFLFKFVKNSKWMFIQNPQVGCVAHTDKSFMYFCFLSLNDILSERICGLTDVGYFRLKEFKSKPN